MRFKCLMCLMALCYASSNVSQCPLPCTATSGITFKECTMRSSSAGICLGSTDVAQYVPMLEDAIQVRLNKLLRNGKSTPCLTDQRYLFCDALFPTCSNSTYMPICWSDCIDVSLKQCNLSKSDSHDMCQFIMLLTIDKGVSGVAEAGAPCRPLECIPLKTCKSEQYSCGDLDDVCGKIACGTCPRGQKCDGESHTCVRAPHTLLEFILLGVVGLFVLYLLGMGGMMAVRNCRRREVDAGILQINAASYGTVPTADTVVPDENEGEYKESPVKTQLVSAFGPQVKTDRFHTRLVSNSHANYMTP